MVRPGRDRLTGRVEVDECYVGGPEEGLPGRLTLEKTLVVVAAQEDGPGIGRIRMRQILDASAESLVPFVQDAVEPGSIIHTDGWLGYLPLEKKGYEHEVSFLRGKKKTALQLMPRVHRGIALLKRWLMGTHQGGRSVTNTLITTSTSSLSDSTDAGQKAAESSSSVSCSRPSRSSRYP